MTVKAGFNPNQIRDPHTGEWVDMPGMDLLENLQNYEMGYGVEDSVALRAAAAKRLSPDEANLLDALSPDARERVEKLTALIDQRSEDAPTLYRCVDAANLSPGQRSMLRPGKTFRDWGFSATAQEEEFVYDWAKNPLTNIKTPIIFEISGARGMNINRVAEDQGWDVETVDGSALTEWLLKYGRSYRVISVTQVTRHGVAVTVIEARVD